MDKKRKSGKKKHSSAAIEAPIDQTKEPLPRRKKLVPARLADKLRRIRKRHNLSQGEMLLIINPNETEQLNRSRVSQYEHGARVPSPIELYNYARFVGVSTDVLLDDKMELPVEYENY